MRVTRSATGQSSYAEGRYLVAAAGGRGRLDDMEGDVVVVGEGIEDVAPEGGAGDRGLCWGRVVGEGGDEDEEERLWAGLCAVWLLEMAVIARLAAVGDDDEDPGLAAVETEAGGEYWVEASVVVGTSRGRAGGGGAGG